MERALALVTGAPHRVSPNPMFGCVLVRDGVVVGEGVTQLPGQAHAEAVALANAGEAARGADMYVTLEPCCHHGRTPPCTDAIVAAGVSRVFAGALDPNPVVHGQGMQVLAAAGLETHVGLAGEGCERAVEPFGRFIREGRPWVVLKAAVTLDGRIATADGDSQWITGQPARRDAHAERARADAVLVGSGTALADDPRLTVRDAEGADPLRVLLDTRLRVPATARALGRGALVFHGPGVDPSAVRATGAETFELPLADRGLDLAAGLRALAVRGVVRLLVEGGGAVHGSLLAAGLADEACFYVAPRLVGRGRPVVDLPSVRTVADGWVLERTETATFGADVRIRGLFRYPPRA